MAKLSRPSVADQYQATHLHAHKCATLQSSVVPCAHDQNACCFSSLISNQGILQGLLEFLSINSPFSNVYSYNMQIHWSLLKGNNFQYKNACLVWLLPHGPCLWLNDWQKPGARRKGKVSRLSTLSITFWNWQPLPNEETFNIFLKNNKGKGEI